VIYALALDSGGSLWLGTQHGGLAKFDGENWSVYNEDNSDLPDNYIFTVAIDSNDNKWIGMNGGGMAVFQEGGIVSVGETENGLPETVYLGRNYPNPFNPATAIRYSLPAAGLTRLSVYDILGREVAVLIDGYESAGEHKVVFNAEGLASGIYFYRLKFRNLIRTGKMVLLK
jgi:hypothetical protein